MSATPTPSETPTTTQTASMTPSSTMTLTATGTQTPTPSTTETLSQTPSSTMTLTATPSTTMTLTQTPYLSPSPTSTASAAPTNAIIVPTSIIDLHTATDQAYHRGGIYYMWITAVSPDVLNYDLSDTGDNSITGAKNFYGIWGGVLSNLSSKRKLTKYSGGTFLDVAVIHAGLSGFNEKHPYKIVALWQDSTATQYSPFSTSGKPGPIAYDPYNTDISTKSGLSGNLKDYGPKGYISQLGSFGIRSSSAAFDDKDVPRSCKICCVVYLERLD